MVALSDDVGMLFHQRAACRQRGEFETADKLRERLHTLGVVLDDRNGGYKVVLPAMASSSAGPAPRTDAGYTAAWHAATLDCELVSLEAYLAHSAAWMHVPRLQTYRELLGKRVEERHAIATRLGERLGDEVAARGTGAVLCVEKPYLEGFMRGFHASGSRAPFVLLAINGGDSPLTATVQARLLTLPGLRACYAHNLHTPPSAAAATIMRPLPLGALPLGASAAAGDVALRHASTCARPWADRDPRLLVSPMRLNSRIRERYLEVLSGAAYAPLVRIVSERLAFSDFLTLLASHRCALSPPGRGHDCFRTWQFLVVGTMPLVAHDAAFDARLLDAGPVGIPAPEDLTPASLAALLAGLRPPDQSDILLSSWTRRWHADLGSGTAEAAAITTNAVASGVAEDQMGPGLSSLSRAATGPRRAPTPTLPPPLPALVVGFSTGHVGTTSLSSRGMYACACDDRAHCRCALANYGFFHELGQRRGLQSSHATLRDWHEAPLPTGCTLAAREAALVARAYLPRWRQHAHSLVLSHDTLYLYKGILAAVPLEQLLFVRIRRARHEFVESFGKYDAIGRDWFHLEPTDHECAASAAATEAATAAVWSTLTTAEKAGWFHDEVEARWQQLRRAHPTLRVIELEWSKARAGSFEAMADALACAAGMRLCEDGAAHRRAGSRKHASACQ